MLTTRRWSGRRRLTICEWLDFGQAAVSYFFTTYRAIFTKGLYALPSTKSQVIMLAAQPEPIAFDVAETAVIVVDMQNDFGAKGGMFDRAGIDLAGFKRPSVPRQAFSPWRAARASRLSILRWASVPISTWALPTLSTGCGTCGWASATTIRAPDGSENRDSRSATRGTQRFFRNWRQRPAML